MERARFYDNATFASLASCAVDNPLLARNPLGGTFNKTTGLLVRFTDACFCIPSGRIDLVAQASKNAYEGGETPAVDYGVRNESSRALSAVKIKIKRQIWFKARGHQKKFKNTIVKKEFDGVPASA